MKKVVTLLAVLGLVLAPSVSLAKGKGGGGGGSGSHGGGGHSGGHSGHGGSGGHSGGAGGNAGSTGAAAGSTTGTSGSGGTSAGSDAGGGSYFSGTGELPARYTPGSPGYLPDWNYGERKGTLFLTPNQEYTWDVFRACKAQHNLMVNLDRLAPNGSFSFDANGGMFNVTRLQRCMEAHGFRFN